MVAHKPRIPGHQRSRAVALMVSVLLGSVAACGGPSESVGGTDRQATVTVFAAGSLTESFQALERAFVARYPGTSVELGLGHSPSQVIALEQGAPADVIATASDIPMREATRRGLLAGAPQPFARNLLQIVVAAGNPENVRGLDDLAEPELTVLLPDPQVPAGRLAQDALRTAGLKVAPDSFTRGVGELVTKVALGEADAGIVYATDVRAGGDRVGGVDIAPADNVVTSYPIAITRSSDDPTTAARFVEFVRSPEGQAILRSFGFLPP